VCARRKNCTRREGKKSQIFYDDVLPLKNVTFFWIAPRLCVHTVYGMFVHVKCIIFSFSSFFMKNELLISIKVEFFPFQQESERNIKKLKGEIHSLFTPLQLKHVTNSNFLLINITSRKSCWLKINEKKNP
jgi:hypothetical protein